MRNRHCAISFGKVCITVSKVFNTASYVRPDITGSFGITGNDADRAFSASYTDGCFTTKSTGLGGLDSGSSGYQEGIPRMVASRASGVYGGSSTVSVAAIYVLMIIKT